MIGSGETSTETTEGHSETTIDFTTVTWTFNETTASPGISLQVDNYS